MISLPTEQNNQISCMKHKNTFHHFQLRSFFKFQFLPRPISVTLTPLIKRCVFLLLHCIIRLHTQKEHICLHKYQIFQNCLDTHSISGPPCSPTLGTNVKGSVTSILPIGFHILHILGLINSIIQRAFWKTISRVSSQPTIAAH